MIAKPFIRIRTTLAHWLVLLVLSCMPGCGSEASPSTEELAVDTSTGFTSGCVPGYRSCDGNSVVVCAADGLSYNLVRECADSLVCTQGICAVCNPNQPFCQGTTVAVCDGEGSINPLLECEDACAGGLCVTCIPGRRECRQGVFGSWETWVCIATGKDSADWTLQEACDSADECSNGLCISPCQDDLKIDTNQGCDYYAVDLENSQQVGEGTDTSPNDAQFAVILYNPSRTEPLSVDVLGNQPEDESSISVSVPPSALETVKLEPRNISGSGITKLAWRIKGNRPFVVYQFNPLDNETPVFSNDASLLLPSNALGRDYLALTGVGGVPFVTIVGTANNTQVTVEPTFEIEPSSAGTSSRTVPAIAAGETVIFELAAGEVLNLRATADPNADLSGTKISSDRIVSVFSGNVAASTGDRCCADHLEQQLPPTKSWGTTFVGARTEPRANAPDHWAVIAREDGTVLNFSGNLSPDVTLAAGEVYRFATTNDFLLVADKPVLVGQFLASSFEVLAEGDFCKSDADCDVGKCSEQGSGGGRCTTTCDILSSDCGSSDICINRLLIDGDLGGTCRYRPCGNELQSCPGGRSCVQGDGLSVCLETCVGLGAACESSAQLCQFTSDDNYCVANECASDADCAGNRCEFTEGATGRCVSDCIPKSTCAAGFACLPAGYATGTLTDGICLPVEQCETDSDCPDGHTCAVKGNVRNCQPIGDPAFILAVPKEQWRDSYTFLAPTGYQEDYANVMFYKGTSVSIDGQPVGPGLLVPGTDARVARIRIDDGAHTVTADKPIGVTVYGYHDDVSYGYPAGVNLFELDAD